MADDKARAWADRLARVACNTYHTMCARERVPSYDWWAIFDEDVHDGWREVVRAVLGEVVHAAERENAARGRGGQAQ